ncbi:MAG: G5 domain-containing protein [Anaerolineales bacterium]|nr:G5 domain-containing protein [Anaerolineales bacterium]
MQSAPKCHSVYARLSARALMLGGWLIVSFALLSGCLAPQVSQGRVNIAVNLRADGQTFTAQVPAGSTVAEALKSAGLQVGSLDKVQPPLYALVSEGLSIEITRGREEFETEQETIPYERQTVRNESLPQGETLIVQPGQNGVREITYRKYFENDVLVSRTPSRVTILEPAVPEIVMVGARAPFAPLPIAGKLVYLAAGSAWMMEGSTSNRIPLVVIEDPATPLDGRIFRLSTDRRWLLYTRKSARPADQEINTLWVLDLNDPKAKPINLRTSNVIHFADFDPLASFTLLYSTVEPRTAAPGWQANNDLYRMKFAPNGNLGVREKIIEANTGGVYGWWGTAYFWSPTGNLLAYSRPDGMGIVSFREKRLLPLLEITPLQTRSDWALIPPVGWGADGRTLFVVTHAPPPGLVNPEESPNFDLNALSLDSNALVQVKAQSGMFAYASASRAAKRGNELAYYVAYLQALLPQQSDISGYQLVLMDRDGSNRRVVFPSPGAPGLQPQIPLWSPSAPSFLEGDFVAIVYEGNLWMIDAATGEAIQVTNDGLIQTIDWK